MKSRPILFSSPMVRALLDGSKTQTRRIVKPQPAQVLPHATTPLIRLRATDETLSLWNDACPYGQLGDRLWVRETWANIALSGYHPVYVFRAEISKPEIWEGVKWKPSIHMPRAASRITLEITDVRVERLQDISEPDAIAEGIEWGRHEPKIDMEGYRMYGAAGITNDSRLSYRTLWDSINGPGSWNSNPWVWAITFKRLTA